MYFANHQRRASYYIVFRNYFITTIIINDILPQKTMSLNSVFDKLKLSHQRYAMNFQRGENLSPTWSSFIESLIIRCPENYESHRWHAVIVESVARAAINHRDECETGRRKSSNRMGKGRTCAHRFTRIRGNYVLIIGASALRAAWYKLRGRGGRCSLVAGCSSCVLQFALAACTRQPFVVCIQMGAAARSFPACLCLCLYLCRYR